MTYTLVCSDNLPYLKTLPDDSIDSIVTDPPYGLGKEPDALAMLKAWLEAGHHEVKGSGFMGKEWDAFVPQPALWKECLRVLKPGGHLLAFAGSRTQDLMGLSLRIAGFEIRDCVSWIYGSGFPKSLDISKALDKQAGAEHAKDLEVAAYVRTARESRGLSKSTVDKAVFGGSTRYSFVEGREDNTGGGRVYLPTPAEWIKLKEYLQLDDRYDSYIQQAVPEREYRHRADGGKSDTLGITEGSYGYQADAKRWCGTQRVTAPSTDLAKQWEGWGSALKPAYEPCLVARKPFLKGDTIASNVVKHGVGGINIDGCRVATEYRGPREGEASAERRYTDKGATDFAATPGPRGGSPSGRWPANVCLDEDAAEMLDEQTKDTLHLAGNKGGTPRRHKGYTPGLDKSDIVSSETTMPVSPEDSGGAGASRFFYTAKTSRKERQTSSGVTNTHPTVKPVSLMRWLVRLVTPPNGTVLDPFNGSGSTGVAAILEGFNYVGIEREQDYVTIAEARLQDAASANGTWDDEEEESPKEDTPVPTPTSLDFDSLLD